jgi:hypothetical protein
VNNFSEGMERSYRILGTVALVIFDGTKSKIRFFSHNSNATVIKNVHNKSSKIMNLSKDIKLIVVN